MTRIDWQCEVNREMERRGESRAPVLTEEEMLLADAAYEEGLSPCLLAAWVSMRRKKSNRHD